MTIPLIASAPGKLFLLGEYAVLDGCPAVVAAVDRRVEVRARPIDTPTIRMEAQGFAPAIEFRAGRPPGADARWRVALAAYGCAISACPRASAIGMELSIRSALDGDAAVKLGLGSSAAVAVAVVAAVLGVAGVDRSGAGFRDLVFSTALAAHRDAQNGIGSGADVAASTFGGVVLFEPQPEGPPRVRHLALPSDAILLVAWTGDTASTPDLIRRYLAMQGPHRHAFVEASRSSVDRLVSALGRGILPAAAVVAGGKALARLAEVGDLPLLTDGLRQLVAIAHAHGTAAKPSGAGGGDCGIAVTTCPATARRLRADWQQAGLLALDVRVSRGGVSVAAA